VSTSGPLRDQYQDLEQQAHAATLGMWCVLVSEILLFSALFALYAAYRLEYPDAFRAAARHTALALGTAMTVLLLSSSLLVALGVDAARRGAGRVCGLWLGGGAACGVVFLVLKAIEYREHLREGLAPAGLYASTELRGRGAELFFSLYYAATGLHAIHVGVGIAVLAVVAWLAHSGRIDARHPAPVELGGMYWHLVDAIWLFLWPLFYLLR
jgi:cytochrome c oxidase subunit 3